MTDKIRVYRFYNIEQGKDGEPFALCDKHAKELENVPAIRNGSVIRRKIADQAVGSCVKCNE